MKRTIMKFTALLVITATALAGVAGAQSTGWRSATTSTSSFPGTKVAAVVGDNWKQESYYRYAPAVFELACQRTDGRITSGTGFAIGKNLLVTNYHVIQSCSRVRARAQNGREYELSDTVAFDRDNDFAVLNLGTNAYSTIPLGDSDKVRVGDPVISIGDPLGLERTLAEGLITGVRTFGERNLFQTSTDASHGSSGSPLINSRGQVIGIIVAGSTAGQKLNFAVPINYVREALVGAPPTHYSLVELVRLEQREQGAVYFSIGACLGAVRIAMEMDSDSTIAGRIRVLRLLLFRLKVADGQFLEAVGQFETAVRFGELTKEQRDSAIAVIARALTGSASAAGDYAKLSLLAGAWLEELALSPIDHLGSLLAHAPSYLKCYTQLGAPHDVIEAFRFLAAMAQNTRSASTEDLARVVLVAEKLVAEMGIAGLRDGKAS